MKKLELTALPENMSAVFRFVEDGLEGCGCTGKVRRQIKLCVEEIYMNIVNYAYNPETGPATVYMEVDKQGEPLRIIISFVDHGKPFDPLKREAPDLDLDLEKRPIGGLGIYLVKVNADEVTYEYRDGENVLTFVKKLEGAKGGSDHEI